MPVVLRCPDGECPVELGTSGATTTVADLLDAVAALLDPTGTMPLPAMQLMVDGRALDPDRPFHRAGILDGCTVEVARAGVGTQEPWPTAGDNRSGTIPYNRPPRPAPPASPEPVTVPHPRDASAPSMPFSLATIGVPVAMAVLLVALFHSLVWGLFSLLGPLMFLGSWVEQRRRGRSGRRRDDIRWRHDLMGLAADLHRVARAERDRRREAFPDRPQVLTRAETAERLWERRQADPDWLCLHAGTGRVGWRVPTVAHDQHLAPEVAAMLDAASPLPDTPVEIDLAGGGIVGIVGDRDAATGLARWLVLQAAVHHGPADLAVAVVADSNAGPAWEWAHWLPHVIDPDTGGRQVFDDPDAAAGPVTERLVSSPDEATATLLLVVDDTALAQHRRSPIRAALRSARSDLAAVVVAEREDMLPSTCTAVVTVGEHGEGHVERRGHAERIARFRAGALSQRAATLAARALARFEDPEHEATGRGLPHRASLLDLIGLRPTTADAVTARWDRAGPDATPAATVGAGVDRPVTIDLAADGPHVLIAGTTGAGKSELLRTLVAALAVSCPPEQLNFVLVDFKGGSAFDRCADLPHVVAIVTDLDQQLASRAVRGLEAELRRRERLLRAAGADDLETYRRAASDNEPLARLVVVIDEFASLAADQPAVLDALVGIARRGRSMGLHLVLATQRPSGNVSDHIRANTNLRIALRISDRADSIDVIDAPGASAISRHRPGHALVRLGPGELVAMQTARVTLPASDGPAPAVRLHPFGAAGAGRIHDALRRAAGQGHRAAAASSADPRADRRWNDPTDLDRLVAAMRAAAERRGTPPPHRPWPEPLPATVDLPSIAGHPGTGSDGGAGAGHETETLAFALADDPDHQRQVPVGWRRGDGNLLLVGMPGSGTTTALASVALLLAVQSAPSDCHLYILDLGAGELAPLAALPHVAAVIGAAERERQHRLVRFLVAELDRRRASGGAARAPGIVVLLDGVSALLSAWDDPMVPFRDQFAQVLADGPDVGIHSALTADRPAAAPLAWSSSIRQRVVFRLADPADYGTFGLAPRSVPTLVPGRAIWTDEDLIGQVGWPGPSLAKAVEWVAEPARATVASSAQAHASQPRTIGVLPSAVGPADVGGAAAVDDEVWRLPIGVGDLDLAPVWLELHAGEHALIAGPARSGRSTALAALAAATRDLDPGRRPRVVAICGRRSPLRYLGAVDRVIEPPGVGGNRSGGLAALDLDGLTNDGSSVLVLVDDVDTVDDPHGHLSRLLVQADERVRLIGAGRADWLRSAYQHWSRPLRQAGVGVLLRPSIDLDGDLLGVTLPRRAPAEVTPGRGWLVDHGQVEFLQVADGLT